MIDQKLIDRINELANKAKKKELSKEEKEEQIILRKKYIELFREGFKQQMESIVFDDEEIKAS